MAGYIEEVARNRFLGDFFPFTQIYSSGFFFSVYKFPLLNDVGEGEQLRCVVVTGRVGEYQAVYMLVIPRCYQSIHSEH